MRIGLTGGIGSGKSTVAALLVRAHGAVLVDTDLIARQLTLPGGAAMPAIEAAFGARVVATDGSLDRAAMRALAFDDAGSRRHLEASRQAEAASGADIVFDVPLLAESAHWRDRVERVLVVDCPAATQLERVLQRPGWTRTAAEAVIAQQASRSARRRCADAVIYNHGLDLDGLASEVDALCGWWFANG